MSCANLHDAFGNPIGIDSAPLKVDSPSGWSAVHAPVAATQATVTKAAGGGTVRHVATGISATIACGATAQTPLTVELLDGAAQVWVGTVAAPANQAGVIGLSGLSIRGSQNTAMTLRFSAAGVAASVEAVTLAGYDLPA